MGRRNRIRGRAAGIVGAVVVGLVGLVGPAASGQTPGAEEQAWVRTGTLPTFVGQEGRIYVAATGGSEEARAFVELGNLSFDASELEGGALLLGEADDSLLPDQARVAACALVEPLPGSGELEREPEVNCRVRVQPQRDPRQGTWTVPLSLFASRWLEAGAYGVALVADPAGSADSWRVAFDTSSTRLRLAAPTPDAEPSPRGDPPSDGGSDARSRPAPVGEEAPRPEPSGAGGQATAPPADPEPSPPGASAAGSTSPTRDTSASTALQALDPADSPAATWSVTLFLLVVLGAIGLLAVRRPGVVAPLLAPFSHRWRASQRSRGVALGGVVAALLALPLLAGEVTLFKLGVILVTAVSAIGLHVLVNWAGELSLAHAAFVGFPAFLLAQTGGQLGISPVYLLPLGIVLGAALGAVIGLPALRAKGLQVALVTLAAGIGIEQFFFTKTWVVGPPAGVDVPEPSIGPVSLSSTHSLYVVLALVVGLTIAAVWALYRSKFVRALQWVKTEPEAATAFGVPVGRYKLLAYALAGGIAGLGGGLTLLWVQRLTADTFPLQRSFTFLVIVVLAGRGFVGGVFASALLLEGGRLFTSGATPLIAYGGPIALIVVLTRYQAGLNGIGGAIMRMLRGSRTADALQRHLSAGDAREGWSLTPAFLGGVVAVGVGFIAIALAWYHAGNTDRLWIQNQELISGGIGGLGLILLGVGLLIRDQLGRLGRDLRRSLDAQGTGGADGDEEGSVVHLESGRRDEAPRREARA